MLHSLIDPNDQICGRVKAITEDDDKGDKCYDVTLHEENDQRIRSKLLNATVVLNSDSDVDSATPDGQDSRVLPNRWPPPNTYVGEPCVACGSGGTEPASDRAKRSLPDAAGDSAVENKRRQDSLVLIDKELMDFISSR